MSVEESGIDAAGAELVVVEDVDEQVAVGHRPVQFGPSECRREPGHRLVARRGPRDDLRQHGVVVRRDRRARDISGVDPDPAIGRHVEPVDPAAHRSEAGGHILGVEASLDRVPVERGVDEIVGQRFAPGDA